MALEVVGKREIDYHQMLQAHIPKTGYRHKMEPRILDFGCGECGEGETLGDYFAGGGRVEIVGIDRCAEMIRRARQRNPELEFIQGDFSNLDMLTEGPFDVVVIRHPYLIYFENSRDLTLGLRQARCMLSEDGIIIGTTYNPVEMEQLEKIIRGCGYYIIVSQRNNFATTRADNFIMIARQS